MKFIFIESFKSLFRAKFAVVTSVVTLSIASLMITGALSLFQNKTQIEERIINNFELRIFLNQNSAVSKVNLLKKQLQSDKRIRSVTFIDEETALHKLEESLGDDLKSLLEKNPLPSSFVVKMLNKKSILAINKFLNDYKNNEIVEDIIFDEETLISIFKFTKYLTYFIIAFSSIFFVISIFLIVLVNKIIIRHKINDYNTMRLVGASLTSIKSTIYLRNIFIWIISVALSAPLLYGIFVYLIPRLSIYRFEMGYYLIIISFIFTAFLLSLFGSIIASRNIKLQGNSLT